MCLGVVTHLLTPAFGKKKQLDFWIWGWPSLYSKFQDSRGYIVRSCLNKPANTCKQSKSSNKTSKAGIGTDQFTLSSLSSVLQIDLGQWEISCLSCCIEIALIYLGLLWISSKSMVLLWVLGTFSLGNHHLGTGRRFLPLIMHTGSHWLCVHEWVPPRTWTWRAGLTQQI